MIVQNSNRAILVLESPWGLDEADSNRSSVLPFIEGIAKCEGNMEVCHANFYDTKSFKQALDCLCKSKYANAIVYVAAHGSRKKIGGVALHTVLEEIGIRAQAHNITGVLLGACEVGSQVETMAQHIQGTALRWCAGYTTNCQWLSGTLIDCSILSAMVKLDREDFMSTDAISEALGGSLSLFSMEHDISGEGHTSLEQSLCFVAQAIGQGNRARDITADVTREHFFNQVPFMDMDGEDEDEEALD